MSRCNTRRNPISPGGEEARVERANAPAVAIAATAPNEAVPVENFGRDKDRKNLYRGRRRRSQTSGRMDSIHGRLFFLSPVQFLSPRTYGKQS